MNEVEQYNAWLAAKDTFTNRLVFDWEILREEKSGILVCRHVCGFETLVSQQALMQGPIVCRCIERRTLAFKNFYGRKRVSAWRAMMSRCYSPLTRGYKNYVARGIYVAQEWHGSFGRQRYMSHCGLPPRDGMSIDRIDNDGPYVPWHVRWATPLMQSMNQRGKNILLFSQKGI